MRILWRFLSVAALSTFALAALVFSLFGERISAQANVDNFSYSSWHVDTHLSITDTGHSVAQVTETLVAQFPDSDQNKGIVRALPLTYEQAFAAPERISVHDASGNSVPFTTEDEDGFRIILIGDDRYVRGEQVYVINYQLQDVIRNTPIAGGEETQPTDEWYWDIIPIERAQPIISASATVTLSPELASRLTGDQFCYVGAAEATQRCYFTAATDLPDTLVMTPLALAGGSGVTLAVGFQADSVVQPEVRLPNVLLDLGPIALGIATLICGATATVLVLMVKRRRARHRGVIIAQYEVPETLPPLLAASIVNKKNAVIAAQIVHLAVNGVLRFEQPTSANSVPVTPDMRLMSREAARDPLDVATLNALFGDAALGTVVSIPKKSEDFAEKMTRLIAQGDAAALDRGYKEKVRLRAPLALGITALVCAALCVVLLVAGSDRNIPFTWLWALPSLILGFLGAFVGILVTEVHTAAGAEKREYLLGVKEFIRVAEADRIRMLQSVSGSDRINNNGTTVLRVYEKLTPYAVLFGEEKEWAQVLESQYSAHEVVSPAWYPTIGVFGITQLNQSFSQFTRELNSAASYTTSSSSGSSGGGYSGGGGGGGFSGGR